MLDDPLFWIAAAGAVFIAGVSKGGFGSGAAFAATPILALVLPPATVVAVMLPVLNSMDLVGLWSYRRKWDWPNARNLLLSASIGLFIGIMLFDFVSEAVLKLALGITALVFVGWKALSSHITPHKPSLSRGVLLGALAGFSSTIAHAGGPLVAMHLLPQRLPKETYQATTVFFFFGINAMKILPYSAIGLFSWNTLLASACLAPFAMLCMRLGVIANRYVSEAFFYRVIFVFVTLVGFKLVFDGLTALT